MTSMYPVPNGSRITQRYTGSFSAGISGTSVHGAVDFAQSVGCPVVAPDDGVIVFANWAFHLPGGPNDWAARWYQLKPAQGNTRVGGGIMTVLRNDQGSIWIKAHLSDNNMVKAGQRVRRGDVIGKVGSTGSSTGAHLHTALLPPNPRYTSYAWGAIDPLPWLTIPYKPNTGASAPSGTGSGTGSSAVSPLPSYRLDTAETPNYTTGRAGRIQGVTIHWWDDPAKRPKHEGILSWFAQRQSQVSAHYVVSRGRVTRVVAESYTAWHAGNATGNATTIGIECDPNDPEGTLPTVAALIRDIEKRHGKMRIFPHDHWTSTGCPGAYKALLPKLKAMVTQGVTTTPTGDWFDMATKQDLHDVVGAELRRHTTPGNRESKIFLDGMAWMVRGSINHMLSPNTKEGKTILGRIAGAFLSAKIPGRGVAKGDMTVADHEGWERNFRSISESQAKQILTNQDRLGAELATINEKLDVLAVAKAAEGKHVNKEGA